MGDAARLLDIVKDRHDGTLAYRKSCRMMICGSCGMRMDGAAVLACKTRMYDIAQAGHVPVISAMGNLPVVKDLVVDMDPFWAKYCASTRTCGPATTSRGGREHLIPQERMNVIHKESLCINCGCCVSECNAMESDPDFLGPQALAKAMRFVGDPRDGAKVERLEAVNGEHGIWECTRCYFCNERCPKGVDPRDAIAKLGAESMKEGIDRDMGAKHAKWFVRSARTTGWLRETELVPKTQGIVAAISRRGSRSSSRTHGKVPAPFPPHVAKDVRRGAAPARPRAGAGPRRLRRHRPGRARARASSRTARRRRDARGDRTRRARSRGRTSPDEEGSVSTTEGLKRVAYYKGCLASLSAKELDYVDAGARAEGRPRADRARVGHLLRRRRHPRGRARLLPPPERAHPRVRGGRGRRHAAHGLQRLHAEPAPGELHAHGRRELRARVNENLVAVGVPAYERDVDVRHLLWEIAEGEGYEKLKGGRAPRA